MGYFINNWPLYLVSEVEDIVQELVSCLYLSGLLRRH